MTPAQKKSILAKVRRIEAIKEETKALYEEMDTLIAYIGSLVPPGEEVDYPRIQKTVKVVDNFEDRNVVFRSVAFRRFEVKVEDY